jgi:hypothetical protein
MLSFARYLTESGWEVKVLTVSPNAYPSINTDNLADVPKSVEVIRAATIDSHRHMSIGGHYLRILALPDRWQSWIISGTLRGIRLLRHWRPNAIMSTFPIASAHAIAFALHRITGIQWLADFRDPMASHDYPADPCVRRSYWWIEKRVFQYARHITVTTQGTKDYYCDRYGDSVARRISVIQNGYDESLFPEQTNTPPGVRMPLRILHSGLVYIVERDPTALFLALAELKNEGKIDSSRVCFVFRSSGYSANYAERFSGLGLEGSVRFEDKPLSYRDALQEMINADGLLALQGSICNMQIPAKVYEYLAAGRPLLALTDPEGDTARLLRSLGIQNIIRLDSPSEIKQKLPEFITNLESGRISIPARKDVQKLSRRARARQLASLLAEIAGEV